MSEDAVEFAMTISEETDEWLENSYDDQLSKQEMVRAAITEARRYRTLLDGLDKVTDGGKQD